MATEEETTQAATQAQNREKAAKDQEKLNGEIQKYNKAMESAVELAIDLNNATAEKLKMDLQAKDAKDKANVALKEQLALEEKIAELAENAAKSAGALKRYYEGDLAAATEKLEVQKKIVEESTKDLDTIEEKRKALKVLAAMQEKYGKDVVQNLKDTNKEVNTVTNAIKKFGDRLPLVGNTLTKVLDQKKSFTKLGGDLKNASNMMKDGFGKDATKYMGEFFTNMSLMTAGAFVVIGAAFAMALQLDDLSKQIGRTTGFAADFNNTLMKGHAQTILSGVSMAEYASSITSLANNFSGFNPTAEKTNQYLATTTSRLEKLGVSADSSSKLMDHFHRAMGLSQKAAADMTAQLVMLGRQVGITSSKLAADFAAASDTLAVYGKNQMNVFKELAAQIKGTGLEMGTLLGMASKFDEFDSAADTIGKLNAVLGTNISTVAMLNMNEAERVKTIKEQVQASVGSFDSLDKHTQRYVTHAMGLKSVAEAQRLLNMSQSETAANAAKMKEQADIQAELAEATASMVPMMQKLKLLGMKIFMVFSPLISFFTMVIDGLEFLYVHISEFFESMATGATVANIMKVALVTLLGALLVLGGYISVPVALFLGLASAIGAVYEWLYKPGSKSIAGGIFGDVGASIEAFGNMLYMPIAKLKEFAGHVAGLWGWLHKPGSLSIAGGVLDKTIGRSMKAFGNDAKAAGGDIDGLSGKMDGLYDTTHKGPGNSFDIQAMASLDTSKIADGFKKIKSAVMELSNIKIDGFLAMQTTGDSSSFIMGSDGLIKSISEGKLVVDVKMPKMEIPNVLVKVFLDGVELRSKIVEQVEKSVGRMG